MFLNFLDIKKNIEASKAGHLLQPDVRKVLYIGIDPGKAPAVYLRTGCGREAYSVLNGYVKASLPQVLKEMEDMIAGLFLNPFDEEEPKQYDMIVGIENVLHYQPSTEASVYLTHCYTQVLSKGYELGVKAVLGHAIGSVKLWATGNSKATKADMKCAAWDLGMPTEIDNHNLADAYLIMARTQYLLNQPKENKDV